MARQGTAPPFRGAVFSLRNTLSRDKTEHRPWGHFITLAEETDHKIKRVVIHPGHRLSLQRHGHRSEHWHAISGEATVIRDGKEIAFSAGQSMDIPKGTWHRVQNDKKETFVFVEVQTGDHFGEDDIERLEDDYGRV